MARPNPILYAERLYTAICAAQFSPISFLAFGTAIKDGVPMRNMPRIAAEPFMRVVGEMLDLEEQLAEDERSFTDVVVVDPPSAPKTASGDPPEGPAEMAASENSPLDVTASDRTPEAGQPKHRNRARKD